VSVILPALLHFKYVWVFDLPSQENVTIFYRAELKMKSAFLASAAGVPSDDRAIKQIKEPVVRGFGGGEAGGLPGLLEVNISEPEFIEMQMLSDMRLTSNHTHTHTHTHKHTRTETQSHTHTHTHTHTQAYANRNTFTRTHARVHTHGHAQPYYQGRGSDSDSVDKIRDIDFAGG
jgi:hypothetical protein